MDHSKDRFTKPSPASNPTRPDPASESEVENAAAVEEMEKIAVVTARDDTNLRSEDEEKVEGGLALEVSGLGADPTEMSGIEGSGSNMENYGSSTGMDNVQE